jgi:hypothetical protein
MDDPIDRIQKSYDDLEAALARFSDEDLITPGKVGTWSVREVMAHLAAWHSWGRRAIEIRLTSDSLPAEMAAEAQNPDPFNAEAAAAWKSYDARQARAAFTQAYADLKHFLTTTPHEKLYRQITRPNGKTTSPVSTLSALAHHNNEHVAELEAMLNG